MADVSEEVYSADSHRSYHRRDRTDRRRANRYGDGLDAVSPSTEYKSSSAVVEDSGVINDLTGSGSADRDSGRRDRRERRKPKEEPEINANDKAPSEGAAATSEERSPKKSLKKESRKSENSARKRQDKKHLREKRRSTGVVMMPPSAGGDSGDDDEVAKQVNANTAKNEQLVAGDEEEQLEDTPRSQGSGNKRIKKKVQKDSDTIQTQQLLEKIDDYEQQLEDYKNELEKVNKELSQLRVDYQKLRDENSSLLNLIGHCQLPAVKPK